MSSNRIHVEQCLSRLTDLGIAYDDAVALRRISITLRRWFELECGDSNDYGSWTIARGHKKNGAFEYDETGASYREYHAHSENAPRYTRIPDRETGAKKRLAKIMARYPELRAYIQGDPRGASLYVLRANDLPQGADINSYYTRGVAVYQ